MEKNNEIRRFNEINKSNEIKSSKDDNWSPNSKYSDTPINGKLKEWFLKLSEDSKEGTILSDTNIMKRISYYEQTWKDDKDLYTFTRNEILDMLMMFSSSSPSTLNVYLSKIRNYLSLAIEQGYIKTNINLADSIKYEDLIELVNKTKKNKKIVDRDYFYNLVEKNIKNRQDQAILLLTFEGIKGVDCIELEQLKVDDFDFDKSTVKINREDKELIINIPSALSYVLYHTVREKIYEKNNGKYTGARGIGTYDLNVGSDYLIKPRYVEEKQGNNLAYVVGRNIQMKMIRCLKDENFLGLPYVTPSSLYLSGIIDRLKSYAKELNKDKENNKDKELELSHKDVVEFLNQRYEKLNSYQTYLAYKDEIAED